MEMYSIEGSPRYYCCNGDIENSGSRNFLGNLDLIHDPQDPNAETMQLEIGIDRLLLCNLRPDFAFLKFGDNWEL